MRKQDFIAKYGEEAYQKYLEQRKRYYQENREQRKRYYQENREKCLEQMREYNQTPKGRSVYLASGYKRLDKQANRSECTITPDWIEKNIFNSKCHYCGESDWHKLGCDRINNDLPHTPDNVVCCCGDCNIERKKMDFKEFCDKKKKGVA